MKYYVMSNATDIVVVLGSYSVALNKQNGFSVESEHETEQEAFDAAKELELE